MFQFTPLLGAQSTSRASQSLLELDGGVKVLVDVGWDERFETRQLAELEKHAPTLSFVLLTHATISHLGAFAHCCKHISIFSQIPVYATPPVIAFGRTLLQDLYTSSPLAATFIPSSASPDDPTSTNDTTRSNILRQAPTFDEINKYFSLITPLKYSQPYQPSAAQFAAPLEGLTLTAYNSGHTLGGTIWHVQYGMESIVYAVDWHQARETVIAGAAWFGGVGGGEVIEQLRKPTALVCSSIGGEIVAPSGGRKARDEALLGHIRSSLAKGGSVLIPTDSSARVLELAWVLEKAWQDDSGAGNSKHAKVYLASRSANATLRHARSLLEWMDDSIVREFEGDDENPAKIHKRSGSKQTNGLASKPLRPFDFRHVKVVERKTQLERVLASEGPRVILASDLSLEWGFSKTAFEQIAQKTENLIILTECLNLNSEASRPAAGARLWKWYQERLDGVALEKTLAGDQLEQVHTGGRLFGLRHVQKAPLNPSEAQRYQQFVAAQRQIQDSLVSNKEGVAVGDDDGALDDDSSSGSSDEEDDEQQGRVLNVSAALGHGNRNKVALSEEDLGVSILLRKKGVYDFDVRDKRGRNAVFPYTHSRKRGDDFGDFIKPEDFLREEEKEEQEDRANINFGDALGQKRKWDDAQKARTVSSSKRQQVGRGGQATDDTEDESSSDSDASDREIPTESDGLQGPAKVVYAETTITVNARLAFVDFDGVHDQRSLQMLIPLIGPKKLILTGGSSQETQSLAADCKQLLGMKVIGAEEEIAAEIFTPVDGHTIDASVDTNAWIVRLSRDLARRLQWQNVKNIGIVTISGELKGETPQSSQPSGESKAKKAKLEDGTSDQQPTNAVINPNVEPILDIIPASRSGAARSVAQSIHVGDLRLADLRRVMNIDGHVAEFRGEGTLLVDGIVAIKKLSSGKIIVEGAPVSSAVAVTANQSDCFAQVKRKIYQSLAVVAAV